MSENPSWMQKVEEKVKEIAIAEGCILYDMEYTGAGKGRALRIYIDNEVGIGVDECSRVSKAFNAWLELDEELIPGPAYALEVSSPGLERHLTKPWHFEKAVGKKVLIKSSKAFEAFGVTDKKWKNSKTVEDVITSANEAGVHFKMKDVEINIPYDVIEKAKIVFDFNKAHKK